MDSEKPPEAALDPAALAEKARKKELHRKSMIWTGAMIAGSALAAAWVRWLPLPLITLRSTVPARAAASAEPAMLVHWNAFSPEALTRARKLDRLILLSLSARWSAPGRRMDAEAYSDPELAAQLEAQVVPVRVDADDRPDLAMRYLGAGWPTTALLLPSGEILDSGTYMTARVLENWVATVGDKFREHRDAVAAAAAEAHAKRAARKETPLRDPAAVLDASRRLLEATWASRAPLFPRFDRLAALSRLRAPWAAPLLKQGLERALTLQAKTEGGIQRDVARDGSVEPVFLLADQADGLAVLSSCDTAAAARVRAFVRAELSADGYYASVTSEARTARVDQRRFTDESARMAAAVLSDAQASPEEKAFAARALDGLWKRGRKGLAPRRPGGVAGLLGDQLGLIEGLLAAGKIREALGLAGAVERALLDEKGQAFYDRPAMMELSEALDRIRVGALNARAQRDWHSLARAAGLETAQGRALKARAEAIGDWLWAHPEGLDAGDLAELAEARSGGGR